MLKSSDVPRIKKNKGMLEKEEIAQLDDQGNVISVSYKYKNPIFSIFEDDLFAELYNARCHDTGETFDTESAKTFREEILKRNDQNIEIINLYSLRLGINSVISLANSLICRRLVKLNLSDNSISDYGVHAIKNILESTEIEFLNLSSNMISGEGLEHLVEVLSTHVTLKYLNLGLHEGSMRKNSLGLQGATSLANILFKNQSIETLILEDNDMGQAGGECFGLALVKNSTLKHLKISENDLKTDGTIHIIKHAGKLESLDLSKNYITADAGAAIEKLLSHSKRLKKFVIQFNELLPSGTENLAQGLRRNGILSTLDLKGNILGDDGIRYLVEVLQSNRTIKELNVSLNEIGPDGASLLGSILSQTKIRALDISKNYLGDETAVFFAQMFRTNSPACKLRNLNISSCRISDEGTQVFFDSLIENKYLTNLNISDNFISENMENPIIQSIEQNFFMCYILLKGNRLSHSCITRVQKICERNRKERENAEPNRLKNEQYRLEYERKKLVQAEEKFLRQAAEVDKVREMKQDIVTQIEVIRESEKSKREYERHKISEEKAIVADKESRIEKTKHELDSVKKKYEIMYEEMKEELEGNLRRKENIQKEIEELEKESKEIDFRVPEMVRKIQDQIDETRKETEDFLQESKKIREEMEKADLELSALKASQSANKTVPDLKVKSRKKSKKIKN